MIFMSILKLDQETWLCRTLLDNNGRFWTILDNFGCFLIIWDAFEQFWTILNHIGKMLDHDGALSPPRLSEDIWRTGNGDDQEEDDDDPVPGIPGVSLLPLQDKTLATSPHKIIHTALHRY